MENPFLADASSSMSPSNRFLGRLVSFRQNEANTVQNRTAEAVPLRVPPPIVDSTDDDECTLLILSLVFIMLLVFDAIPLEDESEKEVDNINEVMEDTADDMEFMSDVMEDDAESSQEQPTVTIPLDADGPPAAIAPSISCNQVYSPITVVLPSSILIFLLTTILTTNL